MKWLTNHNQRGGVYSDSDSDSDSEICKEACSHKNHQTVLKPALLRVFLGFTFWLERFKKKLQQKWGTIEQQYTWKLYESSKLNHGQSFKWMQ